MCSMPRARCPSLPRCFPPTNATHSSATTSRNKNPCAKISSADQKRKPSRSSKRAMQGRNTIGKTTLHRRRHFLARGRWRCRSKTSWSTSTGRHSFTRGNCAACGTARRKYSKRKMPTARPQHRSFIKMHLVGSTASSRRTNFPRAASTDFFPPTHRATTSLSGPMSHAASNARAFILCANRSKRTPVNPMSRSRIG